MKSSQLPRVTVLMAVYNGEKYLRDAMESVLKQSYRDFEFLIINDASKDKTVSIIESCGDSRIRLVHNESNLGLAVTLNRGLDMIKTEFVARMDCDDVCHPQRFEWQVGFMDDHPECGMSGTWLRTFELRGQQGISRYPETPDDVRVNQFFSSPVAHPTLIMRKAMLDRHGLCYNPHFSRTEDFDLCTRAGNFFEIRNLPRIAFFYRRHLQCVTIRYEEDMRAQVKEIVMRQLRELGLTPTEAELDQHCRPCLGQGAKSRDELMAAEEWFFKLYRRMRESGRFAEISIDKVLGRQWFLFCRNSACLRKSAWDALMRGKAAWKEDIPFKEKKSFQAAICYHFLKSAYTGKASRESSLRSTQPLVSVVMPMRNAESFLPDSVGSILRQTYRNFEFVILDDDSSDGSADAVKSFNDKRIRLLRNERQMGVAESLNRGLEEARGKYIARMDADDISMPERLARQVAYLEENTSIAAVGTRVAFFGGPKLMPDLRPCTNTVCGAFLIFGTPIVHPSAMMRKALLNECGLMYRSDFSRSEDYDLWARMDGFGGLSNLPEVMLKYRLHMQSVTSQFQETMVVQHRIIMNRVLKNRRIDITEAELDLLSSIAHCERSASFPKLIAASSLLKKIMSAEPEAPVAMRHAAGVAWLRYCSNNSHFGLAAWREFHAAGLDSDVPAANFYRQLLLARCMWHEFKGIQKEA